MGMFCVYRRKNGDTSLPYITNKAIKNNSPYIVHDTSDGWDSSYYSALNSMDYKCKKLTAFGELGFGFSMEVCDDNVVPYKGGMFISTNGGNYNKMYYQNYGLGDTPDVGYEMKATIIWRIFAE